MARLLLSHTAGAILEQPASWRFQGGARFGEHADPLEVDPISPG